MKKFNPVRDGVTATLITRWLSCRESARLYLAGWTPMVFKESLLFGSLFHDLLRMLYDHYVEDYAPRGVHKLVADAEKVAAPWFDRHLRETARSMSDPSNVEALERDIAVCSVMIAPYVRRYEEDFRKLEWVGLETEFDVEWEGMRLRGKRDGVYRKGKKLWILETKTKGRVDEAGLMEQLLIDFQSQFYMLATQLELGEQPSGVDYNVVRRPGQRLKISEPLNEFAERIQVDIKGRPDYYFMRYEIFFAEEDLDRFNADLKIVLEEFRLWAAGNLPCYRNLSSCVGRWNCTYLPMCSSGTTVGFRKSGIFRELEASQ